MTRIHLFLAVTTVLAVANAALFCWQGYALCVVLAVVCTVVALEINDRIAANP